MQHTTQTEQYAQTTENILPVTCYVATLVAAQFLKGRAAVVEECTEYNRMRWVLLIVSAVSCLCMDSPLAGKLFVIQLMTTLCQLNDEWSALFRLFGVRPARPVHVSHAMSTVLRAACIAYAYSNNMIAPSLHWLFFFCASASHSFSCTTPVAAAVTAFLDVSFVWDLTARDVSAFQFVQRHDTRQCRSQASCEITSQLTVGIAFAILNLAIAHTYTFFSALESFPVTVRAAESLLPSLWAAKQVHGTEKRNLLDKVHAPVFSATQPSTIPLAASRQPLLADLLQYLWGTIALSRVELPFVVTRKSGFLACLREFTYRDVARDGNATIGISPGADDLDRTHTAYVLAALAHVIRPLAALVCLAATYVVCTAFVNVADLGTGVIVQYAAAKIVLSAVPGLPCNTSAALAALVVRGEWMDVLVDAALSTRFHAMSLGTQLFVHVTPAFCFTAVTAAVLLSIALSLRIVSVSSVALMVSQASPGINAICTAIFGAAGFTFLNEKTNQVMRLMSYVAEAIGGESPEVTRSGRNDLVIAVLVVLMLTLYLLAKYAFVQFVQGLFARYSAIQDEHETTEAMLESIIGDSFKQNAQNDNEAAKHARKLMNDLHIYQANPNIPDQPTGLPKETTSRFYRAALLFPLYCIRFFNEAVPPTAERRAATEEGLSRLTEQTRKCIGALTDRIAKSDASFAVLQQVYTTLAYHTESALLPLRVAGMSSIVCMWACAVVSVAYSSVSFDVAHMSVPLAGVLMAMYARFPLLNTCVASLCLLGLVILESRV